MSGQTRLLTIRLVPRDRADSSGILEAARITSPGWDDQLQRERWQQDDPADLAHAHAHETNQDSIERAVQLAGNALLNQKAQENGAHLPGEEPATSLPPPAAVIEARSRWWRWLTERGKAGWVISLARRR
jgi:hypothetical protein